MSISLLGVIKQSDARIYTQDYLVCTDPLQWFFKRLYSKYFFRRCLIKQIEMFNASRLNKEDVEYTLMTPTAPSDQM